MTYINHKPNYDKQPKVVINGYDHHVWQGWQAIIHQIEQEIKTKKQNKLIITIDCYHGVDLTELQQYLINPLIKTHHATAINAETAKYPESTIFTMIEQNITQDRVFGVLSTHQLIQFFDKDLLKKHQDYVHDFNHGILIIYGTGASLVHVGDISIYADLARWEIQQRFRRGELGNWGLENVNEDILRRYKRSFFIEWRVFDRHKKSILPRVDFLLDTNQKNDPKLVTGTAFNQALVQTVNQPFRVVPYFDPGVWGGQWIKEVFDLDPSAQNYAWGFDCVPEENSLLLQFGDIVVEVPSQDLVMLQPKALLGSRVYGRFGTEFPIRFDFLDTMQGQHLSLQVHPLTEYIQQTFGMHYTQDESYYILDAGANASVYLGTKTGVNPDEMLAALEQAQKDNLTFNDQKFINQFPAKKHDHFLIPAGTVHCSGSETVVLEISATPYIFTFKLWDWGRVGLDGIPRPIHLHHGKQVIDWDRNTEWVQNHLINQATQIANGNGWREERTGLHESEFIETRRHWFTKPVLHQTNNTVNVINLIEGIEAIVESPDHLFDPFIVHYAETFIMPASIPSYLISPYGLSVGHEIATIKAYVRGE